VKIALCIPTHGHPRPHFLASVCALIAATAKAGHEVETLIYTSSRIASSRNTLVFEALKVRPDFLLWLDDDHSFPPDAALKLLARDVASVGANYPGRGVPALPTAAKMRGEELTQVYTTREKAESGDLEQVAAMGLGLCLISADVFRKLGPPWFKSDQGEHGGHGEDYYFFGKLKQAGIPAYVDHAVSWGVGHVHQVVLTNEHVTIP
jgi:hypothetical protein